MNKLRLFIGVGICGILFSGCSFIDSLLGTGSSSSTSTARQVERGSDCVPADLMDRLVTYSSRGNTIYTKAFDNSFKDIVDESKCDEWGIEHYKEVVSKEKYLPLTWELEEKLRDKWNICNAMPKWLETKLNEYIEQNKNDDKAYIEASKFKESWQTDNRFNGEATYFTYNELIKGESLAKRKSVCKAIKIAKKAIENDLIDLGGGKKAKCADLSYKDAKKCQSHFDSVYNSAYKKIKSEIDIQLERKKYEQKNKQ